MKKIFSLRSFITNQSIVTRATPLDLRIESQSPNRLYDVPLIQKSHIEYQARRGSRRTTLQSIIYNLLCNNQ